MRIRPFVLMLCCVPLAASAQIATFNGSIHHLDPVVTQSTGNRVLEQLLSGDQMDAGNDVIRHGYLSGTTTDEHPSCRKTEEMVTPLFVSMQNHRCGRFLDLVWAS